MKTLTFVAAALALAAGSARATLTVPLDLSARVVENQNPGGIVHDDFDTVYRTLPDPKQSVERLYLRSPGANFSGHSTQIGQAFASALAESDGNGGVGVSWWLAGGVTPNDPTAMGTLDAQATWAGSYQHLGTQAAKVSVQLDIPQVTVGLIGVPPNRSGPSKTESAQATISVDSLITDASGAVRTGPSFTAALRIEEYQLPLGAGTYQNYSDIRFVGDWSLFIPQLAVDHPSQDEWSLQPLHASYSLGTLNFGESVSFIYRIEAGASTFGYERGSYAFIGDPFAVNVSGGGKLGFSVTPVPEPPPALLLAAGVLWLAWRRGTSSA